MTEQLTKLIERLSAYTCYIRSIESVKSFSKDIKSLQATIEGMYELTDEEIEHIAKPFLRCCGDHWANEMAIPDNCAVEDFARAVANHLRKRQEKGPND